MSDWKKMDCELEVSVVIKPKSPIIVQHPKKEDVESAKSQEPNKDAKADEMKKNEIDFLHYEVGGDKRYYIPGSSLKGIFRNQTEKIFNHLEISKDYINSKHEIERQKKNEEKKKLDYLNSLDPIQNLFGDYSFKGRLSVEDAYFPAGTNTEKRTHVAIDRFRGGAKDKALFTVHTINEGECETTIRIKNPKSWEIVWLSFLLRDLELGRITIGAKTSVGYGHVNIEASKWILHIYNHELKKKWSDGGFFEEIDYINQFVYQSYIFPSNDRFISKWENEWEKFVESKGKVQSNE